MEAGGKITINKIIANDNGMRNVDGSPTTNANGLFIISTNSTGASPAVLTEVTANHNTFTGVQVDTKGAVTLTSIQANDNTNYGLFVDQVDSTDSLQPNRPE